MKKRSRATMQDIISDSNASPSQQKTGRVPPGIKDGVLTDRKGRTYALSIQGLPAEEAVRFVNSGAQVVFDECGCGGTCGFVFATEKDLPTLAMMKPVFKTRKGLAGEISVWRSEKGETVLLASGPVEWA